VKSQLKTIKYPKELVAKHVLTNTLGAYRSICWQHHKKECVVCKEDKIVTVHHMNEDHNDNRPENLVPLCPTHHQYLHSRYRKEIIDIVEDYVYKYINKY
jgi:hypothetical protein